MTSKNFTPPKLFENKVLEYLTRYREVNTYLTAVFYGLMGIGLFTYGVVNYDYKIWHLIVLPIIGIFAWTLTEYVLHRFAFHYETNNPKIKKWLYFIHIAHHDSPRDLAYVTASPIATLPIALIIIGISYLVLGKYCFVFLPGFIIGYITYEFIHHAVHKYNKVPKFLKPLWKHHLDHHFKCPDKKFGVSNMFWDKIFGSM